MHKKYLNYVASELNLTLNFRNLPFARRILELQNGHLDLLVGLNEYRPERASLIYLEPSYEALDQTIFVLKNKASIIQNAESLRKKTLAVTINGVYGPSLHAFGDLELLEVGSLAQKIKLLEKGRVDGFIHYRSSAIVNLKRVGLEKTIVAADYQPIEKVRYFFAISEHSSLIAHKQLLEDVIRNGVAKGEFAKIRSAHYQSLVDLADSESP